MTAEDGRTQGDARIESGSGQDRIDNNGSGAPDAASGPLAGRSAWLISDGKAGDLAQCEGVAMALGLAFERRLIAPRQPWAMLAPWGPIDPGDASSRPDSPLRPPFPELAIASGRRTVPYLRAVRRLSGGKTFTVFLKDPRTGPGIADFIWAPLHDRIAGANVMKTLIGPHRFTPQMLAAQRTALPEAVRALAGPRCTILLGGSNALWRYDAAACDRFATQLARVAAMGASFLVTPSRRSDPGLVTAVQNAIAGQPHIFWDGKGENPYLTFLAAADMLVVTADSANMLGEATATGKPLFYFAPDPPSSQRRQTKFDAFLHMLEAEGLARPLTGPLESWTYEPRYVASEIAEEIARRYGAR